MLPTIPHFLLDSSGGGGYEHRSAFVEFFSVEGVVVPTNGDSKAKPISVGQEERVRPFKAACDELSQGG